MLQDLNFTNLGVGRVLIGRQLGARHHHRNEWARLSLTSAANSSMFTLLPSTMYTHASSAQRGKAKKWINRPRGTNE